MKISSAIFIRMFIHFFINFHKAFERSCITSIFSVVNLETFTVITFLPFIMFVGQDG